MTGEEVGFGRRVGLQGAGDIVGPNHKNAQKEKMV
jgi:hypothetical protein